MKAPYQIKRARCEDGDYNFWLIDTRSGAVIAIALNNTPFAPKDMSAMQARLNSKAVLDKAGVV